MNKRKLKSGFTLVELMIFFIFVSLLLAASAPIITKRVRNLPLRINHGTFVCTSEGYTYYNGAGIVVDSGNGSCTGHFNPPQRAALFKIQMIGGGAGGYNYQKDPYYSEGERTGYFKISPYGESGEGYLKLKDWELWDIFKGAGFTMTTTSGDAGNGGTKEEHGTGVGSPVLNPKGTEGTCTKTEQRGTGKKDADGNEIMEPITTEYACYKYSDGSTESKSVWETNAKDAANTIKSWKYCEKDGAKICYTLYSGVKSDAESVAAKANAILDAFSGYSTYYATGYGGYGGSGISLQLNGIIDYKIYDTNGKGTYISLSQIRNYLQNLNGGYYQTGKTSASGSSCEGWGYDKNDEHTAENETIQKNNVNTEGRRYNKGNRGYDVLYYTAIKAWGRCATNEKRATGGTGGWAEFLTNNYIASGDGSRGTDAYGLIGTKSGSAYTISLGSGPASFPYAMTKTTLSSRHHYYGTGGRAAVMPKARYAANLKNDCVFTIGNGGQAVGEGFSDDEIKTIRNTMVTSLSCNNGTLNYSAEGGEYRREALLKTYDGYKYLQSDGTFKGLPASYVTPSSGDTETADGFGEVSSFPNNIYLKNVVYTSAAGSGGNGSSVIDKCVQPYGWYKKYRVYTGSNPIQIGDIVNFENPHCNEAASVTHNQAERGTPGIIIISW